MKFQTTVLTFNILICAAIGLAADETERAKAPATTPKAGEVRPPGLPPLAAEKIERDVVYGTVGGVDLKLDLYHPKQPGEKLHPVAVYVHGGGWTRGSKRFGTGLFPLGELLKRGYLVVAINYRLAPAFKFPAQIEDAKCAIRYLRAHAGELNLDAKRIGVFGGSAGGHLAALLGTADASAGFDTSGGWTNQSSRVQAVVDMFGPADLTPGGGLGNTHVGRRVFGAKSADDPVLKRASPVTYATKDDPPFLVLHGAEDHLVPLKQSERLVAVLKEAGVPATLVVVTNAGHSFYPWGGLPKPGRQELSRMIADFFDTHLRK